MKKTMIATVLGLSLMSLTFAAQTPAKPSTDSQSTNDTSKPPVKKHKNHKKSTSKTPATNPATTPAPAPAQK